jgi:hypothetical protein
MYTKTSRQRSAVNRQPGIMLAKRPDNEDRQPGGNKSWRTWGC